MGIMISTTETPILSGMENIEDYNPSTIILQYEGEDWYANVMPNEPVAVKGGFEYTIRLLDKVLTNK